MDAEKNGAGDEEKDGLGDGGNNAAADAESGKDVMTTTPAEGWDLLPSNPSVTSDISLALASSGQQVDPVVRKVVQCATVSPSSMVSELLYYS